MSVIRLVAMRDDHLETIWDRCGDLTVARELDEAWGSGITEEEATALVDFRDGYMHEPPDECAHGFRPPRDCPNQGCPDQHLVTLWHKFHAAFPREAN